MKLRDALKKFWYALKRFWDVLGADYTDAEFEELSEGERRTLEITTERLGEMEECFLKTKHARGRKKFVPSAETVTPATIINERTVETRDPKEK